MFAFRLMCFVPIFTRAIRADNSTRASGAKVRADFLRLLALSLILFGGVSARVEAAAEPLTPCSAEPTDMTITLGDVVDCNIDVAGDSDLFRFQGDANSVVVLSLLNLAGTCGGNCP